MPGGLEVLPGELSAFTVTYKPGYNYSPGDTLDNRWNNPVPQKKMNSFRVMVQNDATKEEDNSYNHSLTLNKLVKYNLNAGGWENLYIPGDAWNDYRQNLYSAFHIAYCPTNDCDMPPAPSNVEMGGTPTFVSIEEVKSNNGYALGNIFPNPAQDAATLEFALGKNENVKVRIFNVVGQHVQTVANGNFASGKHTLNINTEGMKPGVYLYTIQAGNYTQTKKFSVVK